MKTSRIALFLLTFALSTFAQVWLQGSVEKISDGDTFRLLSNGQIVKIRLYAIDAPESKQEYGQASKAALESVIRGKNVKVKVIDTDRYGRSVGELWVGDTLDVNLWMVKNGHAWWYEAYGKKRPDLGTAQQKARSARLGLWNNESPEAPWEWRSAKRSAQDKAKAGGKKKKKKN